MRLKRLSNQSCNTLEEAVSYYKACVDTIALSQTIPDAEWDKNPMYAENLNHALFGYPYYSSIFGDTLKYGYEKADPVYKSELEKTILLPLMSTLRPVKYYVKFLGAPTE